MRNTIFILVISMIFIVSLVSCNNEKKTEEKITEPAKTEKLPAMGIDASSGSPGGDLTLHIQQKENISPEITKYRIVSEHNGKPVGFDLILKRPAKRSMFVGDGATFLSLGDTSNNFLNALAQVYGLPVANRTFIDSVTITYADLAAGTDLSQPGNWIAAEIKLFFQTDDDSPELFLNVDEKKGVITLPEKDPEYRGGIVEALSGKKK